MPKALGKPRKYLTETTAFWFTFEVVSEYVKNYCLGVKYFIQGVPGGMCQTSGGCSLC